VRHIIDRYPNRSKRWNNPFPSDGRAARKFLRATAMEAISSTSGPLLEVGGPSHTGFMSIDTEKLPNGLIVSNIEHKKEAALLADVRELPFKAKSLGGILMQSMTRMPEEIARAPHGRGEDLGWWSLDIMQDISNVGRLLVSAPEDHSGWGDTELTGYSLRLALLKEARRTIEPNGVFIATSLSGGEIRLAEQLGFELKAASINDRSLDIAVYNHGEFVFTLDHLDTPAGLFVERLPSPAAQQ
jgi:hypothetical protein